MICTIRTFVLTACLFGLIGRAGAQDPVTERPGQEGPKAAPETPKGQPKQVAKAEPKLLATLEGREEWGTSGSLTFRIYDDGKAVMIDATQNPVTGTATLHGNRLTLTFNNCVYEATEASGVFLGQARYTSGLEAGKAWNFRVAVKIELAGRTFSGLETLPGYGPVTFRFLDATRVEMTDRDGTSQGVYNRDGLRITMTFGAIYTGEIRGDAISGTARDSRSQWTFQVSVPR